MSSHPFFNSEYLGPGGKFFYCPVACIIYLLIPLHDTSFITWHCIQQGYHTQVQQLSPCCTPGIGHHIFWVTSPFFSILISLANVAQGLKTKIITETGSLGAKENEWGTQCFLSSSSAAGTVKVIHYADRCFGKVVVKAQIKCWSKALHRFLIFTSSDSLSSCIHKLQPKDIYVLCLAVCLKTWHMAVLYPQPNMGSIASGINIKR